jgi:hypothetical protein
MTNLKTRKRKPFNCNDDNINALVSKILNKPNADAQLKALLKKR